MDFTKLEGFKVIYYLVLLIVFVALMVFLLRSAKESLRRTGGKWQSVIDEIVIGFIVLISFTVIDHLLPDETSQVDMGPRPESIAVRRRQDLEGHHEERL